MDKSGDRLDSWKEIAEYLGRDRTTVMRWERTAGLPVRRVIGGKRGSVFAYKGDVDRWLAGRAAEAIEPSAQTRTDAAADAVPTSRLRLAAAIGVVVVLGSALAIRAMWA